MSARLSPMNLHGVLRREVFSYENSAPPQAEPKAPKRSRVEWVSAYQCMECRQIYRYEDDAEDCCAPMDGDDEPSPDKYVLQCPVCGSDNESAVDASDCCLWKDLDQTTRHAMAAKVEGGATWAEQLGVWPPTSA